MRLESVTLRNFRGYGDEKTIRISELTTVIGRNDIGKSSILEALEIFFNNDIIKIDSSDCFVRSVEKTIEISCEFSSFPESLVLDAQATTDLESEYLLTANNTIRIKKTFRCTSGKPKEDVFVSANHPTADQYHDLLSLNNANLKKRLKDLAIPDKDVQLNNNSSIRQAIWRACPDLLLATVDVPVAKEDGNKIWEKLSQYLPMFALFQSDRSSKDSDSEVQDPMKLAIAAAIAEPNVQVMLNNVLAAVRDKATDLANRTHQVLAKLDPSLARQLTPEFKSDPKWAGLFSLTLSGDEGIPINKRGSGVRRLVLVSFFKAEAERRLAEGSARNIIYAIEEPETSQHPFNQKILLEAFQDLSSEAGCQVILTTHSPGFASYLPVDSFRFVKPGSDGQPDVQHGGNAIWEEMAEALGVVPDNRVRVLICVEGPTDVSALRYLSSALHASDPTVLCLATDPRVAFVVLGGGTLSHWVNEHYLRALNRPEVHIYDSDVPDYAASIVQVNQRTDGSWGVITSKYEIENYLHPDAINDGLGFVINFGDRDDIPTIIRGVNNWKPSTVKKKLAANAFPKMDAARIRARDPGNEVEGWLRRITAMM